MILSRSTRKFIISICLLSACASTPAQAGLWGTLSTWCTQVQNYVQKNKTAIVVCAAVAAIGTGLIAKLMSYLKPSKQKDVQQYRCTEIDQCIYTDQLQNLLTIQGQLKKMEERIESFKDQNASMHYYINQINRDLDKIEASIQRACYKKYTDLFKTISNKIIEIKNKIRRFMLFPLHFKESPSRQLEQIKVQLIKMQSRIEKCYTEQEQAPHYIEAIEKDLVQFSTFIQNYDQQIYRETLNEIASKITDVKIKLKNLKSQLESMSFPFDSSSHPIVGCAPAPRELHKPTPTQSTNAQPPLSEPIQSELAEVKDTHENS
jgi:uncharacterized protein YsxB (DUF464 family)